VARKLSAGTLLYRRGGAELAVLLVHASGWYNKKAPWGIPKGLIDAGESAEQAARRETSEETGVTATTLHELGYVDYAKSNKRIYAFAGPLPEGAEPSCASWEIDAAEVVPLPRARELLHPDQAPLLDRLVALLQRSTG
jgi:predicted NUDIX family NTP pyrophosphohydrolase